MNGSCHCGAIEVQVPDTAFGVVACHCGDCQKLHGNFFAMLAVDRGEVALADPDGQLRWYASSGKARRAFCARCGSRIAKDPDGSPRLLLSIGLFERTTGHRIVKNVFAESKPDWYALAADG